MQTIAAKDPMSESDKADTRVAPGDAILSLVRDRAQPTAVATGRAENS